MTHKPTSSFNNLYHAAVRAARYIPVRPKDTNASYISDLSMLGLMRIDRATDDWNEPCRPAAPSELNGWDSGFFKPSMYLSVCDPVNERFSIYHWVMDCFSGSTPGHMVVAAASRIEAKIIAVNNTARWLEQNREHWLDFDTYPPEPTPEYQQPWLEFWIKFFDGLHETGDIERFLIIEGAE